jgi:hypothetical protein
MPQCGTNMPHFDGDKKVKKKISNWHDLIRKRLENE